MLTGSDPIPLNRPRGPGRAMQGSKARRAAHAATCRPERSSSAPDLASSGRPHLRAHQRLASPARDRQDAAILAKTGRFRSGGAAKSRARTSHDRELRCHAPRCGSAHASPRSASRRDDEEPRVTSRRVFVGADPRPARCRARNGADQRCRSCRHARGRSNRRSATAMAEGDDPDFIIAVIRHQMVLRCWCALQPVVSAGN